MISKIIVTNGDEKSVADLETMYGMAGTLQDLIDKGINIKNYYVVGLEGDRQNGEKWYSDCAIIVDSKGTVYRTGARAIVTLGKQNKLAGAFMVRSEQIDIQGRLAQKITLEELDF